MDIRPIDEFYEASGPENTLFNYTKTTHCVAIDSNKTKQKKTDDDEIV